MIKKYVLLASLLIPTTSHAVDAFEFCETYRTTMQVIGRWAKELREL